jgi:hypothetical protein
MNTKTAAPAVSVVEIAPNAAKLIESLRHVGYDNYNALADLADNSLDANASICRVWLKQDKGQPSILIADNGNGMDDPTLNQALRLGSMVDKDRQSDLGRFGMGLTTATLSLCRRVVVLTKTESGPLLKAITDVDDMKDANKFKAEFGGITPEDIAMFAELTGGAKSGTVLQMLKVDRLTNSNLSVASDILRKKFGRIFRMFLQSKCKIEINGKPVEAFDPLNPLADEPSRIIHDETFEFLLPSGEKETVRLRVAHLPLRSQDLNKELGINVSNQGFYVLRNLREIVDGVTLDLFTKNPMLNRFRAELHLSGAMDDAIQIDFAKSRVNPIQSLRDKIQAVVGPHITYLRREYQKNSAKSALSEIQHQESENEIAKKAKILQLPEQPKKTRAAVIRTKRNPKDKEQQPEQVEEKSTRLRKVCRFEEVDFGAQGQLYEAYPDGSSVVVQLNTAHPFYQRILEPYINNPDVRTALDYLLFSMAAAEMRHSIDEEKSELLTAFKTTVSGNLRSLCM